MATHISEISYAGADTKNFVEVAASAGTDMSGWRLLVYDKDGAVEDKLAFGTAQTTVAGQDVYLFSKDTVKGYDEFNDSDAVALVDSSGTVVQFLSFKEPVVAKDGPASGQTSVQLGTLGKGQSFATRDDGASYQISDAPTPGTVPCYAAGTLIDTPAGPVPVERLRVGDRVWTADGASATVTCTRRAPQRLGGLPQDARPVLIRAGALGPGVPARDLVVSPQHRILFGGGQIGDAPGEELFLPAKALTALPGVRHMAGRRRVVWHHFACARHRVVRAEGCLSETLLPGPVLQAGLSRWQRHALLAGGGTGVQPARPCLGRRAAVELRARHGRRRRSTIPA